MLFKKITSHFFFFFLLVSLQAQQSIDGFFLVNADSNSDITVLTDGLEIDIASLPSVNLNIRADANPAIVGSVFLQLSGQVESTRTENVAPYALFGDVSGDYLPGNLPVGTYTMTATPYSGANLSGTAGSLLTIQFSIVDVPLNLPPTSIITADPVTGVAPLAVDFTGDSSTDDVGIASYFWDFKDGNTSSEMNPTHIFTTPGDYLVELTVTDAEGLFDTSTVTIEVSEVFVNQPPTAVLEASTLIGNAPLQVTFTGSNSTDDIGITSYLWDFGDGGTSTEADPVYTFSNPGTYEVSLTVFDEENLQDSQTTTITAIDINDVLVQGELKKWHTVQLLFNGPITSETDNVNPFLDYRLNVAFTSPTGKIFSVPGFYAADGNAAETSADSGNKWAVRFSPDELGEWSFTASFRTGNQVAISLLDTDGTPTGFDGASGTFTITNNDKIIPDNRANGRLSYVGGHYYQHEETQTYFLKAGTDSPENMLAYEDFDNTVTSKNWQPHVQDWVTGDPTWQQTKGMGLIGAINYLAANGMNAFSFLTMSVNGDGQDVWPWEANNHNLLDGNGPSEIANRLRYDVSKLEQWEILFAHGDSKGMFLHIKTQETENDLLLDGGELDVQRKLYYRELIARFGHHLALNWNLGEENDLYDVLGDTSNSRLIAYADYINALDPYNHPITVHSFPDGQDQLYLPLLGNGNQLTGPSIQSLLNNTHEDIKKWVTESQNAGKPWAVANDEQGDPQTGVAADASYSGNTGTIPDNRDAVRYQSLWGTLLAGGYGVEYYFGYSTGETDLTAQDFRSRETKWNDAKLAIDFFQNEIPFWLMQSADELTTNDLAYCLAQENEVYVIYLPGSETTNLNLTQADGSYSVQWFDPINGGPLQNGSILNLVGGLERDLGVPPSNTDADWVVLIKKKAGSPTAVIEASLTEGDMPLEVTFSSDLSSDNTGITAYLWDFNDGNTSTESNPTHTFTNPGVFQVSLTVSDGDGLQDTDTILITVVNPNPNTPITVDPIIDQINELGDVLDGSLQVIATGGDGDLVYSATGLPPGVNLDPATGQINGVIDASGNIFLPYSVTITVDDSDADTTDVVTTDFEWTLSNGSCSWTDLTPAPVAKFESRAEIVDTKIYIMGGWVPNLIATGDTEIYEPQSDTWSTGASMPVPTTHVGSVAVGTDIWFIGGFTGNNPGVATDAVYIYDTKADNWTSGPSLPSAVGSGAAAFLDNKIHFIGGLLPDRQTDTAAHLVLDLSDIANGWVPAAPLPIGLNHHWAESVNGIIYSIGGQQGHDGPITYQDVVYAYNPATDIWSQVASLPRARSHAESSTSVHDNKILVTGGRDGAFFFDDVLIYDPVSDVWAELCNTPTPLLAPVGLAYNNQFILSGGGESESNLYLDTTRFIDLQPGTVFAPLQIDAVSNRSDNANDAVNFTITGTGGDPFAEFTFGMDGQPPGIDIDARTGVVSGTIDSFADGNYEVSVRMSKPGSVWVQTNFTWTVSGSLNWFVKGEQENYTGRHECGFVQAGDKFYLMGGRESSRVEMFNYANNSWSNLGDAPVNLNHFQAVEYKGLIWIIGALTNDNFPNDIPADHIWMFDPTDNTWIQGPEIPQNRKRGSAGLVIYNDIFYLVGGNTNGHNGGYVPWFDSYNPATGEWTELDDAPHARDHFYASVTGDKLYALSGRLSGGPGGVFAPTLPEVDVYDFATQQWETLPASANLPTPRSGPSIAVFNGKLIVVGGSVESQDVYGTLVTNDVLKITEAFDPLTQTWERLADANFKRRATQAIVSGNGIHVASGSNVLAGGTQKNMEYYGEDNPTGTPLTASTLNAPVQLTIAPAATETILLEVSEGNVGVFVKSMQLSGNQAADFNIVSGELTNSLLMPNVQHAIEILYSGTGSATAQLAINYGSTGQVNVALDSPSNGNNPPQAVIGSSILGGEVPLQVAFTGEGSTDDNLIVSYLWDFGDGSTSTETNPTHTFTSTGIYDVSLTVSDAEGLQDTANVTITVTDPNQEGVTGFVLVNSTTNEDVLNLFEGLQINSSTTENLLLNIRANTNPPTVGSVFLELTGPVQNTRGESVAPYALFGDVSGDYLGELLPLGNYTISATPYSGFGLTGTQGATVSVSFSIVEEIANQPPVAIASANPTSGTAPLLVDFTGSNSTDDTGIAQFLWNFMDAGATSNNSNTSYQFNTPGTYNVSLTVTDAEGLQDSEVVTILVEPPVSNDPPNAVLSATPESGDVPLEVNFTGDQSSDDTAVVSYNWNFGDGNTSNEVNPSHTFLSVGDFNVTLTVTDEEGLEDIASVTISVQDPVSNTAPTAVISATPESGEAPLEVSFTGDQSSDDVAVVAYDWDFGDGTLSNLANPTHTYNAVGSYTVTLTVADQEGLEDATTVTIVVNPPNEAPTATIGASPLSGDAPLEVSFTGNTSTDDKAITSYLWDFDDNGTTSNEIDPIYTFVNSGTYNVSLTVFDEEGLQDQETILITVNLPNQPPNALATATPLTGDAPLLVNFTGDASSDDSAIASYFWDFKDGSTSILANPSHTFTLPGTYEVSLTVFDDAGLQDTDTITITVLDANAEGVIGFTLVNATSNADILELSNNLQIESSQTNGLNLNIRANTNPTVVGSVRLELQGPVTNIRLENVAPYALFGDNSGNYLGTPLPEGDYTISATSFDGPNQTGAEGATVSIAFSIVPPQPLIGSSETDNSLNLTVYPNPTAQEAHLSLSENQAKIAEVYLYDSLGRKIKTLDSSKIEWENGDVLLPIYDLEEGFYIVVAVTHSLQVVQTKMVVKEKKEGYE
ncbi:MAG: PKD domain-containing protein [Allomuricauda sp.]|nr:MAG: PKD domain-containing protein [Allomuricauda sp.]